MKAGRKKHGCQREPLFCQLQLLLACLLAREQSIRRATKRAAAAWQSRYYGERGVMSRNLFPTTYLVLSSSLRTRVTQELGNFNGIKTRSNYKMGSHLVRASLSNNDSWFCGICHPPPPLPPDLSLHRLSEPKPSLSHCPLPFHPEKSAFTPSNIRCS